MLHLTTTRDHQRQSTRDLLLRIRSAVEAGETRFHIEASGQHDIGGPLWSASGETLHFDIENPGQRVGSMALPGTEIVVHGPAPADVGWLNAGGDITVLGDAGDTAGHCAAAGIIRIAGRAGARSGSLMKHDPLHAPPELWVLNSVGSFAFEFMGGGMAVVCGLGCVQPGPSDAPANAPADAPAVTDGAGTPGGALPHVLGERPCVGMVGGVVYVRGQCPPLPPEVRLLPLDRDDEARLRQGLPAFLEAIGRPELAQELGRWPEWHKIVPAGAVGDDDGPQARNTRPPVREFHAACWPEGGLFGDVLPDDGGVAPLVAEGDGRLRAPVWNPEAGACAGCLACVRACPRAAIRRRGQAGADGAALSGAADAAAAAMTFSVNARRCIGCGLCAAVCPAGLWSLRALPDARPAPTRPRAGSE